jgi:SAM-dependent methyltransferase
MKQGEAFFGGEGDAWYKRNKKKLPIENDPILKVMEDLPERLGAVLEIGCSNGWRLEAIKRRFSVREVCGIDASQTAARIARDNGINAYWGLANSIPFPTNYFDLVIYGFVLYLVDREHLFRVVDECDRVLRDGGYLIIQDFACEKPFKRRYKHKEGLWSYHQPYEWLFRANPAYRLISTLMSDPTKVSVLRKNVEKGWPECQE